MRHVASVAAAVLCAAALGGCTLEGTSDADVTVRDAAIPFTFRIPPQFTDEDVSEGNTRGDVVLIRALDKVNVVAVRKVGQDARDAGEAHNTVMGRAVTSRLRVIEGAGGFAIECQWTADRRKDVLDACDKALRTLKLK